ncbi:unnamed protein product [Discosporangium mesarthrocarpum]
MAVIPSTFSPAIWSSLVVVPLSRPSDARAHHNLALCLHSLGEAEASLGHFEHAFSLDKGIADAAANAAGLLIQQGDGDRASALCYQALESNPQCSSALHNLNTALRMAGRQGEAMTFSWRWIIERCPQAAHELVAMPCGRRGISSSAHWPQQCPAVGEKPGGRTGGCSGSSQGKVRSGSDLLPDRVQARADATGKEPGGRVGDDSGQFKGGVGGRGRGRGRGERKEPSDRGTALTVACVRWGDKYGPDYVRRLEAGVRRNLTGKDFRFVCFTDDPAAVEGAGVEARGLPWSAPGLWQGWWHKAWLFSRNSGLHGRVLYLDLDTIIVGSLGDIAGYTGRFGVLSAQGMDNENRDSGFNSSVMAWEAGAGGGGCPAGLRRVCEVLEEAYEQVTACVHKFDHWLEMSGVEADLLQEIFPGQIVEYMATCQHTNFPPPIPLTPQPQTPAMTSIPPISEEDKEVGTGRERENAGFPKGSRIVCFPLNPKPHQCKEWWVWEHWCGNGEKGHGIVGCAEEGEVAGVDGVGAYSS